MLLLLLGFLIGGTVVGRLEMAPIIERKEISCKTDFVEVPAGTHIIDLKKETITIQRYQ